MLKYFSLDENHGIIIMIHLVTKNYSGTLVKSKERGWKHGDFWCTEHYCPI